MRSRSFSARAVEESRSADDSKICQSARSPPSLGRSLGSSALMTHDLGELAKRPLRRHAGSVGILPFGDRGDLVVAQVQLHAKVNEAPLLLAQLGHAALVALQHVGADGLLQGRGGVIVKIV